MLKKRYRSIVIIGASCCLLLFVAHRALFFTSGAIERYSSYLMYPILVVQNAVVTPIKSFFQTRKSVSELEFTNSIFTFSGLMPYSTNAFLI